MTESQALINYHFMEAVKKGDLSVIKFMMNSALPPTNLDECLHFAIGANDVALVQCLLAADGNPPKTRSAADGNPKTQSAADENLSKTRSVADGSLKTPAKEVGVRGPGMYPPPPPESADVLDFEEYQVAVNLQLLNATFDRHFGLINALFSMPKKPTNLTECQVKAANRGDEAMVTFLQKFVDMQPPQKQKLCVNHLKLDMSNTVDNTSKNSTFMVTVYCHPEKALAELNAGLISLEEINHQNDSGWTVLHYLIKNHENKYAIELIQKLIDLGADVNLKTEDGGNTPLIMANKNNDIIFDMLVKHPKIDVNLANLKGETVLIRAFYWKKLDNVKKLLNHPTIDVKLANSYGETALMMACQVGQLDIIRLLAPKSDIYAKDKAGKSAIAYCYCKPEIITEVSEILFPAGSS